MQSHAVIFHVAKINLYTIISSYNIDYTKKQTLLFDVMQQFIKQSHRNNILLIVEIDIVKFNSLLCKRTRTLRQHSFGNAGRWVYRLQINYCHILDQNRQDGSTSITGPIHNPKGTTPWLANIRALQRHWKKIQAACACAVEDIWVNLKRPSLTNKYVVR